MIKQTDRTVELLQRLTGSKSEAELNNIFAPGHIILYLSHDIAQHPQSHLILSFATNLLSRLHPVVQKLEIVLPKDLESGVVFPRWRSGILYDHITKMLEEINPPVDWSVNTEIGSEPQVAMILGNMSIPAPHSIYIGSNGWEVYMSPDNPVRTGSLLNPIGAYAAGAMAVGEVWKRLLFSHSHLFPEKPIIPIDKPLKFSCFTYESDSSRGDNPPLHPDTNLERLTIIGLGAGGGATAFSLASLPNIKGKINIIEPDEVISPNLNRYVFASDADAIKKRFKSDIIESIFCHHTNLIVNNISDPFSKASEKLSPEDYSHVVAAVHSRIARREIQYETPKILWDAGATEDGDFQIWRIIFGQTECMFCKHPPESGDTEANEANQLSKLLGFSHEYWMIKIRDNTPFSSEEKKKLIQRRKDKNLDFDIPEVGERFSDWLPNQCGRLFLPEIDQEIPIPFAPVMAGILIAGEVIKEKEFPNAVVPHYYWNNLVGSWMRRVVAQPRSPKTDCSFCNDQVFIDQFKRHWEAP